MIHESRKEALSAGAKTYFTGKPCNKGNYDFRYSATGGCLCEECKNVRRQSCKNHYQNNKAYYSKKHDDFYAKNGDSIRLRRKQRGANNRDAEREGAKKYYWLNRDRCIFTAKLWIKNNYERVVERNSVRRAKCKKATPAWANMEKINWIYRHAQLLNCWDGPRAEVDHIVPLVSDLVCGLHCEQNLQVMWKHENLKKGNRYWPDMPEGNHA